MRLSRSQGSATGRGQSLVEFALVLPIAILLLMAIFDVGRAVFAYNGLTNAAREGARLAVVNQDEALIEQRVTAMTYGTGVSNLGDADFVRFHKEAPNLTTPTSNPACAPVTMGCVAILNVESDWSAITPIIGQIIGPITFRAGSELPVEFVCPNANIPAYSTSGSCPSEQP
ncbi:MAG: pilus assembly protein [Acidobacteria bacterium]|nr:pilus assembly protein [Acidobacteriota bacterium]